MQTPVRWRHAVTGLVATSLITCALLAQAAPARYYKWQGSDRVVCAQTSPGHGWIRLNGFYVKADCSI